MYKQIYSQIHREIDSHMNRQMDKEIHVVNEIRSYLRRWVPCCERTFKLS
jgi:hypothetical protein